MLPMLAKKKDAGGIAGTIIKNRTPDEKPEEKHDDGADLLACAKDVLNAVQMNSPDALADALKEMFQHLEKAPHEEGEHTNKPSPHTYDAQREE